MIDVKNIDALVSAYIEKNLEHADSDESELFDARNVICVGEDFFGHAKRRKIRTHGFLKDEVIDEVDFLKLYTQAKNGLETFSEMLLRLIDESGEKSSDVYNRANIDRRHFSKIANHADYKPSKQTVLAFAIALKLDFERTRELLAVAGFVLSKASLFDVIVSFFIEYKIFDVDLVNQTLYKYEQPLLGG